MNSKRLLLIVFAFLVTLLGDSSFLLRDDVAGLALESNLLASSSGTIMYTTPVTDSSASFSTGRFFFFSIVYVLNPLSPDCMDAGIDLRSGNAFTSWIDYDPAQKNRKDSRFTAILDMDIDVSSYFFQEHVYLGGFSAPTEETQYFNPHNVRDNRSPPPPVVEVSGAVKQSPNKSFWVVECLGILASLFWYISVNKWRREITSVKEEAEVTRNPSFSSFSNTVAFSSASQDDHDLRTATVSDDDDDDVSLDELATGNKEGHESCDSQIERDSDLQEEEASENDLYLYKSDDDGDDEVAVGIVPNQLADVAVSVSSSNSNIMTSAVEQNHTATAGKRKRVVVKIAALEAAKAAKRREEEEEEERRRKKEAYKMALAKAKSLKARLKELYEKEKMEEMREREERRKHRVEETRRRRRRKTGFRHKRRNQVNIMSINPMEMVEGCPVSDKRKQPLHHELEAAEVYKSEEADDDDDDDDDVSSSTTPPPPPPPFPEFLSAAAAALKQQPHHEEVEDLWRDEDFREQHSSSSSSGTFHSSSPAPATSEDHHHRLFSDISSIHNDQLEEEEEENSFFKAVENEMADDSDMDIVTSSSESEDEDEVAAEFEHLKSLPLEEVASLPDEQFQAYQRFLVRKWLPNVDQVPMEWLQDDYDDDQVHDDDDDQVPQVALLTNEQLLYHIARLQREIMER